LRRPRGVKQHVAGSPLVGARSSDRERGQPIGVAVVVEEARNRAAIPGEGQRDPHKLKDAVLSSLK